LAYSEYFDGLNGKDNRPVRQNLSNTAFYNTLIRPSTLTPGYKSVLRKGFYEI